MKKRAFISLILLSFFLFSASAHSGRTDSQGGHRDNKNVSGLGPYHYHHGYGPHLHPGGVCPYSASSQNNSSSGSSSGSSFQAVAVGNRYNEGYGDGYDEGYAEGHEIGYNKGFSEGYQEGYNHGHTEGVAISYDTGYAEGYAAAEDYLQPEIERLQTSIDEKAQAEKLQKEAAEKEKQEQQDFLFLSILGIALGSIAVTLLFAYVPTKRSLSAANKDREQLIHQSMN